MSMKKKIYIIVVVAFLILLTFGFYLHEKSSDNNNLAAPEFSVVEESDILKSKLGRLYKKKIINPGVHSIFYDDYTYIMISLGERDSVKTDIDILDVAYNKTTNDIKILYQEYEDQSIITTEDVSKYINKVIKVKGKISSVKIEKNIPKLEAAYGIFISLNNNVLEYRNLGDFDNKINKKLSSLALNQFKEHDIYPGQIIYVESSPLNNTIYKIKQLSTLDMLNIKNFREVDSEYLGLEGDFIKTKDFNSQIKSIKSEIIPINYIKDNKISTGTNIKLLIYNDEVNNIVIDIIDSK